MTATPETLPEFARLWVDLAQPRLGAAAIHATDEFFAPKERMIDPAPLSSYPANMTTTGNGWTAGRAGAGVGRVTTIAPCGSAGRA
ncbi:MAG TPA: hypothetical protein VIE35_08265 [Dongiaceae bacterium]